MGGKDTRRARKRIKTPERKAKDRERSGSFNGKFARQTKCGFCAQKVDTMMHYELDGTCPKRIVYGPPAVGPDDPTYNGEKSYILRRAKF
jgi:hypothetical protein